MKRMPHDRLRSRRKSHFTLIEILMAMVIVAILATILLPSLREARTRARFVRWFAFNRTLANDPDCVINFNFQDGPGTDVLRNGADGCDSERYQPRYYNGYLGNKNGGKHNFEWVKSGGRFGKYKHALQFNGVDTYIAVPTTSAVDFNPGNDFTVLTWIKFDELGFGDCPFSKSLWGTASDAACQYDIYSCPYSGSFGQGTFDIDVFTTCGSWKDTDISFEKEGWVQLGLRYRTLPDPDPTDDDYPGEIMCFVNGQPLGDFIEAWSENPKTSCATEWKACSELQVPLILGAAGCYRKYWNPATYDPDDPSLENTMEMRFFFKGKMDEFLVFKRALSNEEIAGHYEMGRE